MITTLWILSGLVSFCVYYYLSYAGKKKSLYVSDVFYLAIMCCFGPFFLVITIFILIAMVIDGSLDRKIL